MKPEELGISSAFKVDVNGALCEVSVRYPRQYEQDSGDRPSILIDLIDVRAADYLCVRYDFERDGWVMMQQPGVESNGHIETVGVMQEVAFVPSYGLVAKETGESARVTDPNTGKPVELDLTTGIYRHCGIQPGDTYVDRIERLNAEIDRLQLERMNVIRAELGA